MTEDRDRYVGEGEPANDSESYHELVSVTLYPAGGGELQFRSEGSPHPVNLRISQDGALRLTAALLPLFGADQPGPHGGIHMHVLPAHHVDAREAMSGRQIVMSVDLGQAVSHLGMAPDVAEALLVQLGQAIAKAKTKRAATPRQ